MKEMEKATLTINGNSILISGYKEDTSVSNIEILSRNATYEPWILHIFKNLILEEYYCFDIGANIGVISIIMAQLASKGKVFAFEPFPSSFDYLCHNVKQNNIDNVDTYNMALANFNGVSEILTVDNSYADAQLILEKNLTKVTNELKTGTSAYTKKSTSVRKFDDWFQENDIDKVDLLKVDIEGSEILFLEGAEQVINNFKPDLVIEFNPHTLKNCSQANHRDLFLKLKSLYPKIYLIRREDGRIVPLSSDAQLMGLMLTGHNVEDLYCTYRDDASIKELEVDEYSATTYTAASISLSSTMKSAFLNMYPDGWIHQDRGVLVFEADLNDICSLVIDTYLDHVNSNIYFNNELKTVELYYGQQNTLSFHCEQGLNFVYFESNKFASARSIWNNEDPRFLSIRVFFEIQRKNAYQTTSLSSNKTLFKRIQRKILKLFSFN
ncbi:FkbM family methyltransferase [Nostocaceae cyanobacterium CENA357]|uniref:FkbM family methyltransferase n=1 Tax=Atlanticothrix silvestris CENA357 TaxID=1725252 RepID=A0A8J7H8E0_9CYAN|nr:FkbM family methyltransferase [Atlanticothrix silvestris]MBH8552383.1 FkbM family methyltransferase [Atlanticothrix silvestris CENA357]